MFETYRFPPDYLTFWHIGARMGIGPVRRFLRRMRRSGHVRLLDIGSGAGSNSLLAAVEGMTVVSCDLSSDSLAETRRVAHRLGTAARNVAVRGDSCLLPFSCESFDIAIASHIIEHLDSPTLLLSEIHRVLRPGGMLRLSCPSTAHAMRISRWFRLRLDPEDHKVEGYGTTDIVNMLPSGLSLRRCTYQGRFFESNIADCQHVVSRWLGMRANPIGDAPAAAPSGAGPSFKLRAAWVAKEFVLLPALALCTLEDMLCFFVRGSMISLEIEKE